MRRSLPPAGHPIQLKEIIFALLRRSNDIFLGGPSPKSYFFSSATGALTFSLSTLKGHIQKKQVILPAYSCPSIAASTIKAGLEPILCDLTPRGFGMDLDQLGSKMGKDTLAVIGVHLFGIPENILRLKKATEEGKSLLIEDAAQAFGNKLAIGDLEVRKDWAGPNGDSALGFLGDIGLLSFGRGKPLTLLSGGAILANNRKLLDPIDKRYGSLKTNKSFSSIHYLFNLLLYSFFYHPNLYWIPQRLPFLKLGETIFTLKFEIKRINRITLSLGRELIGNFEGLRKRRRELIEVYQEGLKGFRDEFFFFPESQGKDVILLRFPVVFKDRNRRGRILFELQRCGLGATGMYPVPLNEQEGIKSYLRNPGRYPNAKFIADRIVTLPVHDRVRIADVLEICSIFKKYL